MQSNETGELCMSMFDGLQLANMALGMVAISATAFMGYLLPKVGIEAKVAMLLIGAFLLAISLPCLYKYRREPAVYAMLAWILFILGALAGVIWLVNSYVPFKIVAGVSLAVAAFSLFYVWVLRPPERA